MTSKNFIPSLIKSIVAFENPVTNPHGAAKNLLSQMASQQVKVVLSGEGADEWFGGYAYLRIQKLQRFLKNHPKIGERGLHSFLERENGKSMNHLDGSATINNSLFETFFEGHRPAVLGRLSKARSYRYLTGDDLGQRLEAMCIQLSQRLHEEWPSLGPASSEWDLNTWFGLRVDLLHYILANVGDRQEMSHSLEGRTPFMDPEVINVATHIEVNSHLRALTEKDVLKKMALKLLPPHLANRPKHPFFAPIKYFYLRQNQEIISHYLHSAREATPWLAWDRIDRLLQRKPSATDSLEGLRNSTRMHLFSLGALVEHLREIPAISPRGYAWPATAQDLEKYRVSFKTRSGVHAEVHPASCP